MLTVGHMPEKIMSVCSMFLLRGSTESFLIPKCLMVKMSNHRLSNTKMNNSVLIRSKTKSVPERWILTVLSKADMPDDDNVNSYALLEVGGARKAKRKVV